MKKIIAFILLFAVIFTFAGCSNDSEQQISYITEVEEIIEGGGNSDMPTSSTDSTVSDVQSSDKITSSDNESQPTSSVTSDTSSDDDDTVDINYEWKSHPQDYKLLAFTFDDGPGVYYTSRLVELFEGFEGAATFFINGTKITGSKEYNALQTAIDKGWAIGNHGATHLVATTGGANGEATYDELKADISDFSKQLSANLHNTDGSPYEISLYRPPNIDPTETTFKICTEDNLVMIWDSVDSHDWDSTKNENDVYNIFKSGVGSWVDGDIILSHEWSDATYNALSSVLGDFYRAGYRFCSVTDLMKYRNISRDSVAGELNDVDDNNGMVKNIVKAATYGKK